MRLNIRLSEEDYALFAAINGTQALDGTSVIWRNLIGWILRQPDEVQAEVLLRGGRRLSVLPAHPQTPLPNEVATDLDDAPTRLYPSSRPGEPSFAVRVVGLSNAVNSPTPAPTPAPTPGRVATPKRKRA